MLLEIIGKFQLTALDPGNIAGVTFLDKWLVFTWILFGQQPGNQSPAL